MTVSTFGERKLFPVRTPENYGDWLPWSRGDAAVASPRILSCSIATAPSLCFLRMVWRMHVEVLIWPDGEPPIRYSTEMR